jgi:hypothetical protein
MVQKNKRISREMLREAVNCVRINSILQQPHGYKLQESHSKSTYR